MNLLIQQLPLLILLIILQQIGIEKATLQQQLHFRLKYLGFERDGRLWYCQTYTKWKKQARFWNEFKSKCLSINLKNWLVKLWPSTTRFLSIAQNCIHLSTVCSIRFTMPTDM